MTKNISWQISMRCFWQHMIFQASYKTKEQTLTVWDIDFVAIYLHSYYELYWTRKYIAWLDVYLWTTGHCNCNCIRSSVLCWFSFCILVMNSIRSEKIYCENITPNILVRYFGCELYALTNISYEINLRYFHNSIQLKLPRTTLHNSCSQLTVPPLPVDTSV